MVIDLTPETADALVMHDRDFARVKRLRVVG